MLDHLNPNATLLNAAGTSAVLAPLGSPYVLVRNGDGDDEGSDENLLRPRESSTVLLEFLDPAGVEIDYDTRLLSVTPAP